QVDGARPDLLPEIRDSVEPDEARTLGDIKEKRVKEGQEHFWVAHIQVDLVRGERGPDLLLAGRRRERRQQRQRPRADDLAQVGIALDGDEPVPVARVVAQEALEGLALRRDA